MESFISVSECTKHLLFYLTSEVDFCSGLLTGRFKKGDTKAPEGSRMELGTKLKIGFDNLPDINQYLHDEKFWSLMDAMEKIAKKHGDTLRQSFV